MNIIGIILLAIIAYLLLKIYRQREDEKKEIARQKYNDDMVVKQKEEFKDIKPNTLIVSK